MLFFVLPYRILFHDTMAYGSQHHMANIKLQNLARETLLFSSRIDGRIAWQEQLRDLLILTREAYSLNLLPVALGETVAVLMTYEEPTRSTFRLCFRIIDSQGKGVALGYQTMIVLGKESQALAPAPRLFMQYVDSAGQLNLLESCRDPSFADRLKAGGTKVRGLLSQPVCEIGERVARAAGEAPHPRFVDE